MHIEKNVFENLFNTVMGVKGKSKDNGVACREDIREHCVRPELHVYQNEDGKTVIPSAKYCLKDQHKLLVLEWIQSLKFPDGYSSNLGAHVDLQQRKLVGYKTHDAHVFIERLMPIAFKGFLPEPLWEAIAEICTFFKDCCCSSIDVERMSNWKHNIAKSICKLEVYFPPSFFDSKEHVTIHVADEVLLGGPVQYRWMYPFERFIFRLKAMATNKSSIEATIVNSFIMQEIAFLGTDYLEPNYPTKAKKAKRNEVLPTLAQRNSFSVYNYLGYGGKSAGTRRLTMKEFRKATNYILTNTPEVDVYYAAYKNHINNMGRNFSEDDMDDLCINNFPEWFKAQVWNTPRDELSNNWLTDLCGGFDEKVTRYKKYKVNNYKFHTEAYDEEKSKHKSNVLVQSDGGVHFYGVIKDIFSIRCTFNRSIKVMVFECEWFDPNHVKHYPTFGITEVNLQRPYKHYDPFILAQQAKQVYYTYFPGKMRRSARGIVAACQVKPTNTIDMVIAAEPFQGDVENATDVYVDTINNIGPLADDHLPEVSNEDDDEMEADESSGAEYESDTLDSE